MLLPDRNCHVSPEFQLINTQFSEFVDKLRWKRNYSSHTVQSHLNDLHVRHLTCLLIVWRRARCPARKARGGFREPL